MPHPTHDLYISVKCKETECNNVNNSLRAINLFAGSAVTAVANLNPLPDDGEEETRCSDEFHTTTCTFVTMFGIANPLLKERVKNITSSFSILFRAK